MKIRLFTITAALLGLNSSQLSAQEEAQPNTMSQTPGVSASSGHLQFASSLNLALNASPNHTPSPSPSQASEKAVVNPRVRLRLSRQLENLDGLDVPADAPNQPEPPLEPGAIQIEGDSIKVYPGRRMLATGNAVMTKDTTKIQGDKLEFDAQNQALLATGNAKLLSGDTTVVGPRLKMNMRESTGEMEEASFFMLNTFSNLPNFSGAKATDVLSQNYTDPNALSVGSSVSSNASMSSSSAKVNIEDSSDNLAPIAKKSGFSRGDAKMVYFEGEDKKRLKNARYTTCAADSDAWYMKAGEIKLDDYSKTATATNAVVDFKGVPILYSPWIKFSYLNERKSGFLAPVWGTTTQSGFEIQAPYYWNISPNMDATMGVRYLSKRGEQYQGEFRYLTETYRGVDSIEYLPNDSETGTTRYYIKMLHDQTFGNGWSANYNFEKVSDDTYFSDMTTRITSTSRVNLPQQASVAYSHGPWAFTGMVQKYQTLDGVSYPYQRLPQLTLKGNDDWSMFNLNLNSEWVMFDRKTAPITLSSSSTGNTGVITTSVTGSRFSAYPSISMPLAQPYGFLTPKLGVRYTSYNLTDPSFTFNGVTQEYQSKDVTLPVFSVDGGLFFDRTTQVVKNTYTQTLEPRMYYVYIPYQNQSLLPIFDTGEADLNLGTLFLENQFTGGDRVNNANQLSLALSTRMIDANTGVQRLAATLGQRFYFADQKVGLPISNFRTGNTSDIVAAATANLTNKWNVDTAWQYNNDTSRTIKANIGTRYSPEPGKVLNLGYRYTKERLEQFNISGQWPMGGGWYGVGRWNYSLSESRPIEGLAGVEYDAGCWVGRAVVQRVPTTTTTANYALFFQLELGGVASVGSNPIKVLSRSISGYTSSSLLPDSIREQNYE